MDVIHGGKAHGDVARKLLAYGDPGYLRPWLGENGKSYVTVNQGGKLENRVTNALATLRKDEWRFFDEAVIRVAKERLRAVADLLGLGLTFNIPNGFGHTTLQHETMSDITPAQIDMEGKTRTSGDTPVYEINHLPLPIIHKDFGFSARRLATSRNLGVPLDVSTAELAGRRVAEAAEDLLLGSLTWRTFDGGQIYGYTNYVNRLTKTLTTPGTPATTLKEVLEMKSQSKAANYYGPWILYYSPAWDVSMNEDFSAAKGTDTLRERLLRVTGINAVEELDRLPDTTLLLVQTTSDVVREVIGMNMTTLQWDEQGGMDEQFKVMSIMVPQLRSDQNGNTGIVHGSVP